MKKKTKKSGFANRYTITSRKEEFSVKLKPAIKRIRLPKYLIKRSKNNQYYWVLIAPNGKVILTSSEQHTQKHSCKKSIYSSKKNIQTNRFTLFGTGYHFRQYAKNGEQLGKSEIYSSFKGMNKGVNSVIKNAPIAYIADTTL